MQTGREKWKRACENRTEQYFFTAGGCAISSCKFDDRASLLNYDRPTERLKWDVFIACGSVWNRTNIGNLITLQQKYAYSR